MLTPDFMKLWLIIIILNYKNGGAKSWLFLPKVAKILAKIFSLGIVWL